MRGSGGLTGAVGGGTAADWLASFGSAVAMGMLSVEWRAAKPRPRRDSGIYTTTGTSRHPMWELRMHVPAVVSWDGRNLGSALCSNIPVIR